MEKWAQRVIDEFFELVQVDSVSGKERLMADLLLHKLRDMGLEAWEDNAGASVGGNAGNVITKLSGTGNGPTLLLCAHMDTVEPGWGVHPVLEEGVIRSAGDTILGGDDKAGVAAILEALRWVLERQPNHGGLEIVFTIWEEGGLFGAKNLDYTKLKAQAGYVLDSNGQPGCIVTNAPSHDRIKARITGRSAHAGICPETGVNAIQIASHAIAAMKLGRIDEETTCNIGVINGGQAPNIVPDSVTIIGEARSRNIAKRRAQTEHMCQAIEKAAAAFSGQAEIQVEQEYEAYNLTEQDLPVSIALEAAKTLGLPSELAKTGGGSDANVFNKMGIPTTVLGIGMKQIHTTDEYIRVEDLLTNVQYLYQIILTAASRN